MIKVAAKDVERGRSDIEKVGKPAPSSLTRSRNLRPPGVSRGGLCVDAVEAPERCPVPRRHRKPTPDSDGSNAEGRGYALREKLSQR